MKNYVVTKLVTKLGFGLGVGIIVIAAIAGISMMGFKGLIGGALVGAVLAVPLMLVCEMASAVVAIEENTRK